MLAQSENRIGVGSCFTGVCPLAGFGLWVVIALLRFLALYSKTLRRKSGNKQGDIVTTMGHGRGRGMSGGEKKAGDPHLVEERRGGGSPA